MQLWNVRWEVHHLRWSRSVFAPLSSSHRVLEVLTTLCADQQVSRTLTTALYVRFLPPLPYEPKLTLPPFDAGVRTVRKVSRRVPEDRQRWYFTVRRWSFFLFLRFRGRRY